MKYKYKVKYNTKYKVKVKYYDTLLFHKKEVLLLLKNYILLRQLNNKSLKQKIVLSKNIKFYYDRFKKINLLKISSWKPKRKECFFFNKNHSSKNNDFLLYNLWNMKSSYLKYVFFKLRRSHPYRQLYHIANKNLLVYPHNIIIKPYTILIKNYYVCNFLLIFEWFNKWKQDFLVLKIINKTIIKKKWNSRSTKTKTLSRFKFNNNIIISLLCNTNKYIVLNLFKKKLSYLYWLRENWLWRFRNKWLFLNLNILKYTKRYRLVLLKLLKNNFDNKNYYEYLPLSIYTEKFTINFIKNLFLTKINKRKNKNKFYKVKNIYLNKFKMNKYMVYRNLYFIFFFWVIYYTKKIYLYIQKILYSLWFRYYYLIHNISNNNINIFFYLKILYLNKYFNYKNIFNLELYYVNKYIIINKYFNYIYMYHRSNIYVKVNHNDLKNNFYLFFYNFISMINNKMSTYYFKNVSNIKNRFHYLILDNLNNLNYIYIVNYNKIYIQTYKKYSKIPYYLKNIDVDLEKPDFNKIHQGLILSNPEQAFFSKFNLNINEDKKLYFI